MSDEPQDRATIEAWLDFIEREVRAGRAERIHEPGVYDRCTVRFKKPTIVGVVSFEPKEAK